MVQRGNAQFAEFVAQLSADDAELLTDLKKAETDTKASATRMQGSLDKLKVSGGNLSGVLGTLSQAGAAAGGSLGGIVGQGVAATQALAGMATVVAGPGGLIAGLAALTIGVAFYREESASWLNSMLQSIGVLEDLDAALAKAEGRLAEQESRLKRQTDAHAALNDELRQRQRILTATRTNNPEVLADAERQNALERRIAQARAAGGGENAVDVVRQIFAKNKEIEDSKRKQKDFEASLLDIEKQRLAAVSEREKKEQGIAALTATRVNAAQALLISLGSALPSEFIGDPVLKRLAQLAESLNTTPATPTTGTFGSISVRSPLADIRGGEAIGQQQINTAESHKRVSESQLRVAEETRDILRTATTSAGNTGNRSLQITGNPR